MAASKEWIKFQREQVSKGGDKTTKPEGFQGPSSAKRSCTDCFFLLMFIAFLGGMGAVAVIGLQNGNPDLLINGYDFNGNICGVGDLKEYPVVFYPRPTNLAFSVCLRNCTVFGAMCVDYKPENTTTEEEQREQYLQFASGDYSWCFVTYPTLEAPGVHRCIPDFSQLLDGPDNTTLEALRFLPGNGTQYLLDLLDHLDDFREFFGDGGQVVNDLLASLDTHKESLLITAGVGLVVGFLYMLLLQFFVAPLVWLTILLVEVILAAAAAAVFFHIGVLDVEKVPGQLADLIGKLDFPVAQTETDRNIYLGLGIVLAVAAVVVLLLIVTLFGRIHMAIQVVKQAAKAVRSMPALLVVPVVIWILIMGVFAYWVVVFVFLASSGTFSPEEHTYEWDDTLRYLLLYHLFGLLWARAMLSAVTELVMAGAIAQWYFPPTGGKVATPVLAAVKNTLRYHLGSAALGSLIIAIVEMVRVVFNYFCVQIKAANQDNAVVKCLMCCVNCCLACLERFINFLNRNAYIQVAIHGVSFCKGAKDAFSLLLRNCLRVAAITPISSVFVTLGSVLITVVTAFLGALIMMDFNVSAVANADPFVILVMVLIGFTVGSSFMAVYTMAIDTVFQCYCMDEEWETGHTSPEFRKFMEEQESGKEDLISNQQ